MGTSGERDELRVLAGVVIGTTHAHFPTATLPSGYHQDLFLPILMVAFSGVPSILRKMSVFDGPNWQ